MRLMSYSMMQLACCCVTGCTHNYRVFVPCNETPGAIELIMPVTHKDNLAEYGIEEGKIYHYDALRCADYCGSWQCVEDANDEDNWCYLSASPQCGNTCDDWENRIEPPYLHIRPSEWTNVMASRWTDLAVSSCCDTPPLLCNVDCGFGDVIPSDCGAPGCYDPSLLGWSVQSSFGQSYPATAIYYYEGSDCNDPVPAGTQITTNLSAQIVSADSYVNLFGGLSVTFVVKTTTTTSPIPWSDFCDPFDPSPPCCWICYHGDPDCNDSQGSTFERYFRYTIDIPCMGPPTNNTSCYDPSDPNTCDTTPVPSLCGGALPSATVASSNPVSFTTTFTDGHAIGWGGNAVCFTLKQNISWGVPGWCFLTSQQGGAGKFEINLSLSLPPRPAACP